MMNIKRAIKAAIPHGIIVAAQRSKSRRQRHLAELDREPRRKAEPYSYAASVDFLCRRGLPGGHVIGGSMPEESLAFCADRLAGLLPRDRPILGLHVGNFLGVSLAYFTDLARNLHPGSVVVSIDPNLTHRGIERPQDHVIALLNNFGLQRNAMILVGYSGEKSVSNDGVQFGEYDPVSAHGKEQACERSLQNLVLLGGGRFDFAVMDGNHDAAYLRKETEIVRDLLTENGVLILDDVDENWAPIKAEYAEMGARGWRPVGADGRVGILLKNETIAAR
jgi:hypothetical protein